MRNYQSPIIETVGAASNLIQFKPNIPDDGSGTGHRAVALDTPLEGEE